MVEKISSNELFIIKEIEREKKSPQIIFLRGPSGIGKSYLINKLKKNGILIEEIPPNLESEDNFAEKKNFFLDYHPFKHKEIQNFISKYKNEINVVVVDSVNLYDKSTENFEFPYKEIFVKALTDEKIDKMSISFHPEISESEKNIIKKYSLGIPLLIKKFTAKKPVLEKEIKIILENYLKNISNTKDISIDSFLKWKQSLSNYIKYSCGRKVPKEILSKELFEDVGKNYTPITIINNAVLSGISDPVPKAKESIQIYRQWIKNSKLMPSIDIFIKNSPYSQTKAIMNDLGILDDSDIVDDKKRIDNFGGTERKAGYYINLKSPNQEHVEYIRASEENIKFIALRLNTFLENNNLGKCNHRKMPSLEEKKDLNEEEIQIFKSETPFMFHTSDHALHFQNPISVGLAIETYLQSKGIKYQVLYGNEFIYQYDPQEESMKFLEWKNIT